MWFRLKMAKDKLDDISQIRKYLQKCEKAIVIQIKASKKPLVVPDDLTGKINVGPGSIF